jgi:hypothetical protein
MALSNLIWWPWFGIGTQEPPVEDDYRPMGDRRLYHERIRRHPVSEDEMWVIAVILSEE